MTKYQIAKFFFNKGMIDVSGDKINIMLPYSYTITTAVTSNKIVTAAQWENNQVSLITHGSLIVHYLKLKRKL